MNGPLANGCMDTAQKVAFVAQLSLLGLIFHHTSRTQLAWVSEGLGGVVGKTPVLVQPVNLL